MPWGWWVHRPFVSVANSAALARAGITGATEAPYNVEIVKDEDGEPTGVFLDRTYAPVMEFTLFRCVPRLTFEDQLAGCLLGSRAYSAVGTTSIYEGHGLAPPILEAYRRLREAGELSVRGAFAAQRPQRLDRRPQDGRPVASMVGTPDRAG